MADTASSSAQPLFIIGQFKRSALPLAALFLLFAAACSSSEEGGGAEDRGPSITGFQVEPEVVDFGEPAVLSWATSRASKVMIWEGEEPVLESTTDPNGVLEVSPAYTTTYRLVASAGSQEASKEQILQVRPAILDLATNAQGEVVVGKDVQISWRTGGALELILSTTDGFERTLTEGLLEGSALAPVPADGIFTLMARSGELEVVKTVKVLPLQLDPPSIVELAADPQEITAGIRTSVTVSWQVEGASSIDLSVNGAPLDVDGKAPEADALILEVDAESKIVLVATNLAGEVSRELTIQAFAAPAIERFAAAPARVRAGETFELAWDTSGAVSVEIELDGEPLPSTDLPISGSLEQQLVQSGTYLLRAFNAAGASVEAELDVGVGGPIVASFAPQQRAIAPGIEAHLLWRCEGGTSLEIRGPEGDVLCTTSDPWQILEGGCAVTPPSGLGTYEYSLTVGSGDDRATAVTEVKVVNGPTIVSFVAAPASIDVGEEVTLSWVNDTDMEGLPPNLALSDNRGGIYDLQGADPLEGELKLTLQEVGSYEFTLHASTPGTTDDHAFASVEVHALPAITLVATPEDFDPDASLDVELRWEAEGAASLELWALDEDGAPTGSPLAAPTSPAEIASGAFRLDPQETTTYRVVAANANGTTASAEVTVRLLLAEIVEFEATPDVFYRGEGTRLHWRTAQTHRVTLEPDPGTHSVSVGNLPFIDLSQSEDARVLEVKDNCGAPGRWDEPEGWGCPLLEFPEGFTFPYSGNEYTWARVFVDGILNFDIERDNSAYGANTPRELPIDPSAGGSNLEWNELLAPFWRDLEMTEDSQILYELRTDDRELRHLIVQWSKFGATLRSKDDCETPINFQVVLWEGGTIDFRYSIEDRGNPNCNGEIGSIGLQTHRGTKGFSMTYNKKIVGGLDGRSYTFEPVVLEVDGGIDLLVAAGETYTLTAHGARGSSDTRSLTLAAEFPPEFSMLRVSPEMPSAGSPALISWAMQQTKSIEVQDMSGAVICSKETTGLPFGSCEITEEQEGLYQYRIVAEGSLPGKEIIEIASIDFAKPFGIIDFKVSPERIDAGTNTPVTVEWTTVGSDYFMFMVNDVDETELHPGISPESGSLTFHPEETTTFTIVMFTEEGMEAFVEKTVEVRTLSLGDISVSPTTSDGTQDFSITWSATPMVEGEPYVTLEPEMFPLVEVGDGSAPFIDLSTDPGATQVPNFKRAGTAAATINAIQFPDGFSFPYFGKSYGEVHASTNGYLSFTIRSNHNVPQPLLEYASTGYMVHIAPFWEYLRSYNVGDLHTKLILGATADQDQMVIQWTKLQLNVSPIPAPEDVTDDLTFQVGLFRDGSIEFRYKTMTTNNPDPVFRDRVGASRASIGFKGIDLVDDAYYVGHQLYLRPANPVSLGGKSFRYQARKLTDSLDIRPSESTSYSVCVTLHGYKECKTVGAVIASSEDLIITELHLNPSDGPEAQWFELRNASRFPIDLNGMTIRSRWSDDHTIDAGAPLVVQPGAHIVLAASGEHASFVPDYVYGNGITLGAAIGSLTIANGNREVATAEWDEAWTIPQGKSLSLDAIYQVPGLGGPREASMWCVDEGSPGKGFGCSSRYYDFDPHATRPFIDISGTGQALPGATYGGTEVIPGGMGFAMPYFGDEVSTIWVSSSGFAAVGGIPDIRPVNEPIPSGVTGFGTIAPLWDNLTALSPSISVGIMTRFFFERRSIDGQKVLILQWTNYKRRGASVEHVGKATFQTQLWENGDIVHAYGPIAGVERHFGSDATIGIEALDGQEGIEFSYQLGKKHLYEGKSILFERRATLPPAGPAGSF